MASTRVQLLRFVTVGISNTALTSIAYAGLVRVGTPYLLAGAIGYLLGGVNSFLLNRRWTFSHRGRMLPAATRYAVITALGVGVNLLALRVAVGLGAARIDAQVLAAAPVTLTSFALSRAWAFAQDAEPTPTGSSGRRPRRGRRRAAHGRSGDLTAAGERG